MVFILLYLYFHLGADDLLCHKLVTIVSLLFHAGQIVYSSLIWACLLEMDAYASLWFCVGCWWQHNLPENQNNQLHVAASTVEPDGWLFILREFSSTTNNLQSNECQLLHFYLSMWLIQSGGDFATDYFKAGSWRLFYFQRLAVAKKVFDWILIYQSLDQKVTWTGGSMLALFTKQNTPRLFRRMSRKLLLKGC